MKTRYYVVDARRHDKISIMTLLDSLSTAWHSLRIKKIRVFLGGKTRLYLTIASEGYVETLLTEKPLTVKRVHKCPSPKKRWKGEWREFTVAENLRYFVFAVLDR
jgi:hypothetical protein